MLLPCDTFIFIFFFFYICIKIKKKNEMKKFVLSAEVEREVSKRKHGLEGTSSRERKVFQDFLNESNVLEKVRMDERISKH